MDKVGIHFQWHHGAQFHQGKTGQFYDQCATTPLAAANGQNRLSVLLQPL